MNIGIVKSLLFLLLICSLFPIAGCTEILSQIYSCDGVSYSFNRLYSGYGNMSADLYYLIRNNTYLLSDCAVVRYSEITGAARNTYFDKFNVMPYNATFTCGNVSFGILIYKKDNNYYKLYMGMGPCDKENVYFVNETAKTSTGGWYYTESWFENEIIQENLNYYDFCSMIGRKVYSDRLEYAYDECLSIQASINPDLNKALEYCDKIVWVVTKIDCYKEKASYYWMPDPAIARKICDRLNSTIDAGSPYKYIANEC